MRILVCGGRSYEEPKPGYVDHLLDQLETKLRVEPYEPVILIEGGAWGADRLAGNWAEKRHHIHIRHPAQWVLRGKVAGGHRNQAMLDLWVPDIVVALPGGAGTADMVERAKLKGTRVKELKR